LRLRVALIAAVLAVSCARPERPRVADSGADLQVDAVKSTTPAGTEYQNCGDQTIRGERVGDIAIGDPVDSLKKCRVVRDTVVPGGEGTMARKVFIALSKDTIAAEIVDGRVWRIEVSSPGVRTADSIGVGTSLRRLLELSDPRGASGEGRMFVLSPDHCGHSFEISHFGPMPRAGWTRATMATLPESTHVIGVLVVSCHPSLYR